MVLLQTGPFTECVLVIVSFVVVTVPVALGILVFVRRARRHDDEVEVVRRHVEEPEERE